MVGVLASSSVVNGVPRTALVLAAYLTGLLLTALPVGVALGWLGGWLDLSWTFAALLTGILAIAYGLHDLRLLRLPHPQRRTQVPNHWRRRSNRLLVAFGYGAGLGPGFLVFVRTGGFFVVVLAVLLAGSPLLGALAFGGIAVGRFVFLAGARLAQELAGEKLDLLRSMARIDPHLGSASGLALAVFGSLLLVVSLAGGASGLPNFITRG